jgi:pimeloyl-ACP methyl ester carboxylesterase
MGNDKINNLGFVLIPGGGMGGWIWQKLVPLLNYPAYGVEDRADSGRFPDIRAATVADCVDHVVAEISKSGFKDVVLVGHSGAGCLLQLIAAKAGGRVRHLVFLSANVPPQGKRTVDVLPFLVKMAHVLYVRRLERGRVPDPPPEKREAAIRKYFCNCCDEETIRFVLGRPVKTEPPALLLEKIFRPENPGLGRTFIRLLRDMTASRALQDRMIRNLGGAEEAAIDADHMAMLSRPRELAEILNRIAARVTA